PPAESSPGAGASAAPASAAPAAEAPPSAKVAAVAVSKESVMYVRAKIVFSNPSKRACRILGYKLVWAGKSKPVALDLIVPPGETPERWLRVNPGDGALVALAPESGLVELQTDCAAR